MVRLIQIAIVAFTVMTSVYALGVPTFGRYRINLSPCGYGAGGRFTTIAFDPLKPGTMLVGSDVAGVFKSVDGGKSFRLTGQGLNTFAVADIAYHPFSSQRVYLLTDGGFYISDDGGKRWQRQKTKIRYNDRFFGSRLMAFSRYSLWVATNRDGVFQIPFQTKTFKSRPVPGLEGIKINGLVIFKNSLVAATKRGVYRYAKGAWRSWNKGLDPAGGHISDIVVAGKNSLFLVAHEKGAYAWNPDKQRWQRRSPGIINQLLIRPESRKMVSKAKTYKAIAADPFDPGHLLLATHPDNWPHLVFSTRDGGRSWRTLNDFKLSPDATDFWAVEKTISAPEHFGFSPHIKGNLFLLDFQNVWQSKNGGKHFSQMHKGLQNVVVNDIKIHPADPGTIYISAADNGLMVSTDGGRKWQRIMNGVLPGHAQELEISKKNHHKMYLLANPWHKTGKIFVYKSVDGGRNWKDVSIPVDQKRLSRKGYVSGWGTNLEIDPESDDTVYAASNGYGVHKTIDGGRSWRAANIGLKSPYIQGTDALLIHPQKNRTLFASTLAGGVYKSIDGARSWRALQSSKPFTLGMAFDPRNPSRLLVADTQKKMWLSINEGETFKQVALPGKAGSKAAANVIAFYPQDPNLVLVGTVAADYVASDGFYVSTDGGAHFKTYPLRLPKLNVNEIVFGANSPRTGYIGFNGITIFRLDLERQ
jgi:photosystem II stability/assembly factor-like uncharacterized protein